MKHHWSVDEKRFKKEDPDGYRRWLLIQRINYGLGEKKLKTKDIQEAWPYIKDSLEPLYRRTIEFFVWPNLS